MEINSKYLFKKFKAYKLENSEIIYINKTIENEKEHLFNSCRYSTNFNNSKTKQSKEFLADRYGGDGILRHGGSGRCGFDGEFQIKGIGATPLLGSYEFGNYRDGNLSLYDAYYETILGELFEKILPWGAARTNAIIIKDIGRTSTEDSCLLVRYFPFRPAHFMRAPFYKNTDGEGADIDVKRTKEMLSLLPNTLKNEKVSCQDLSPANTVRNGVTIISQRLAEQMACAKLNNILHGSVSASNLQLNGKWMDLGCSIFWSENFGDHEKFLQLHLKELLSMINILSNLCFYIEKYSYDLYEEKISGLASEIKYIFIKKYDSSINENLIPKIINKNEIVYELSKILKKLKASDNQSRFIFNDAVSKIESLKLN